jgi:para-nitrobenzyl esterase
MPRLFRDGVVLPKEDPLETLRAGRHHAVPVVLGTNRDEVKLWLFFDSDWVRRWFGILPRVRDRVRYAVTAEYRSQVWKATGADGPAEVLSRSQAPGVWVYRFDWDEEPTVRGADLSFLLGAAHALEIPFVFSQFDVGDMGRRIFTEANRAGREALSAQMMSYWVEFARSGDPGRGREGAAPRWAPWREGAGAPGFLVFDTPAGGGLQRSQEIVTKARLVAAIRTDPRLPGAAARCDFLADLARWADRFDPEDYRGAGCRTFAARRTEGELR